MLKRSKNISVGNNKYFQYLEQGSENDILLHKFNLFQQFFILGIEPKILHLINKVDITTISEPIIGPKIISKFPNIDLPYLNIPDTLIISHCFPKGFINSIVEYKEYELNKKLIQTKDFIFSLDNFEMDKNISLRTNKVYYTCFMFYEKLDDYQTCINLKNNSNNKNNKNKNSIFNKNILIPKVICLSSFSPYIQQSKLILHYLKENIDKFNYNKLVESNIKFSNEDNNLSLENIIEGLIYNIPSLPRSNFMMKIQKDFFVIGEEPSTQSNINEKEIINDKEIIFSNSPPNKKPSPVINYAKLMKFFKIEDIFEIIKIILLEEPILFFCSNIEDLTYTIKGLLSLIYPFEYHYPVVEVLPEHNYTFINFYKSFIFGINHPYSDDFFVFKGINLDEKKFVNIVIIEKRFNNILNSSEKEKTKILLQIKQNNSRYLKISQKSISNSISEIKELYIRKKNMIGEHKEEEKTADKFDETKIKLPIHYYSKCCKKLENNLESKFKDIKSKIKEKDKTILAKKIELEKEKIFNDEIIENFLYFFTSIFLHYQEFCSKFQYSYVESNDILYNTKVGNYFREKDLEKKYCMNKLKINDLFNCELFIDDMVSTLDKPFYTKFLQTKIFFNFMKKKIFPMSTQDKLDILFFDEKINEKLSREKGAKKIKTKFLEYDVNNISGDIDINCLSRPFSDIFKNFVCQEKNKNKILSYFQYVTYESVDNEIKNNSNMMEYYNINNNNNFHIKFYYFVFPKLLNDGILYKENNKEEESNKLWNITTFTYKNSNCLYNQFEKEGFIIINDENITKNYQNYYYSLNPQKSYSNLIEYYIKILYLEYFSKIFHLIPYSKKNDYFSYLMHFMIHNQDTLDDNSIMMMFNAIIKHGDKNMAQSFFPFIRNKTYTTFLMLREKTRPDKNFIQVDLPSFNNFIEDEYDIDNIQAKKRRSLSEYNSTNIRLSGTNFRDRKYTSAKKEEKDSASSQNLSITMDEETGCLFEINDKFDFTLNLFCNQKKEENMCNYPFDLSVNHIFKEDKKYIEFRCLKCNIIQQMEVTCKYKDDNNKEYTIQSKLYSPAYLLERGWFKNSKELNLNDIIEKYFDEYICAMYYFYDQGLLCDFLLPDIITKKALVVESNNNLNVNIQTNSTKVKEIIKTNTVVQNPIQINNNLEIPTSKTSRGSIFDISDQKQSFFEFKSNFKKPSLINHHIKKKSTNKKMVGFTVKNKKVATHRKNNLSYSDFLNK